MIATIVHKNHGKVNEFVHFLFELGYNGELFFSLLGESYYQFNQETIA
jgi:hypothetical protein